MSRWETWEIGEAKRQSMVVRIDDENFVLICGNNAETNAHLIATAPAFLKVCEKAGKVIKDLGSIVIQAQCITNSEPIERAIDEIKQVIASAKNISDTNKVII